MQIYFKFFLHFETKSKYFIKSGGLAGESQVLATYIKGEKKKRKWIGGGGVSFFFREHFYYLCDF